MPGAGLCVTDGTVSPRPFLPVLACLALCFTSPGRLFAQSPNDKAARVLEPLLKRPGSGPLFERFVNAWLDSGTLEDLGKFLTQRVAANASTPNRLILALFHSRQGEPVKALEQFRAALASDPGSPDIWYQKALLESRTLDFDASIASLGNCLAAKPATELSLQASQLLGRLLARSGRTDVALKTWRALIASRPDDEELREDILELQIAENLWPAALESAAQLVEKTADPYRRVLRRMRLGDVLDRSGQREKALETFAACLVDTGAGSWLEKEILSQIGKLFRREDDLSGLRAYFAKLLPQHAHRAGLQRAQARLLMQAGETDAAIACGRALMAISPGDRAVREEFIALLNGAGRATEAVSQAEQLLAQSPDDLELRLTLADLRHHAKDTAGALAELRTYEQKAAGREGTAMRLAGLMDRYGLTDEAVQTLRAALRRADQPEARLMLASLLHKAGRKHDALAEWQSLTTSGILPVIEQAARAMQAHGETESAWQIMQAVAPKAETDPVFLTQFCTLADSPERARAALTSARRLVDLARTASDLNIALDVAQRIVRLSGQADPFTAELAQSAATAQGLCFLATLREAASDSTGANAALEKARDVAPELALAQLVRLWTMRGDFARAAAAAEMLFNSPGGRQGHTTELLASLHQRSGNPEAALRWTQEWKRLVPGATAPVLAEARILEFQGRETEALTALRSAVDRFEGNADIRARLAAMSMETGRTTDALRLYSTLYEEAADLSAKMRWLQPWGETALRAGQLENLITQFEDRRRENRESVAPLMALAELHRVADNYDARRTALTEAARLKPDDPEIALEIARLESREGNDEAAIQTLRPMLPADNSGQIASLLADLLISNGQLDEGLKLLTDSTAASPAAVELTALSLARRGGEESALFFLQPHLLTWSADWRLHFLAAHLEWKTDHPDAAVARLLTLAATTTPLARPITATSTNAQTYEEMVVRLMPPDVQRLFRLLLAKSALNGNSNNSSFPVYPRQSVYTQLPSELDELQDRSAALVMEIAKTAPPERQVEWTAELERRGFAAVRLFPDLPPTRRLQPAERHFDFAPLLHAHPDNRPLLALASLATAYRQWNLPADTVMAEKAWAAFHRDAPLAALFLALPGAGRSEPTAPWEDEMLAAAEKLEKPPPLLTLAVVRSAGLARNDDDYEDERPVPSTWRQRLIALLERWRAATDAAGGVRGYAETMRDYAFRGLAQEHVITKAAAPLAALLDAEWRRQASRPPPPPQVNGDDPLAQPLGFPPWFLPGLPDTLRDFMQRYLTPEAAALAAPLVQEPLLRIMLTGKAPGASVEAVLKDTKSASAASAVPFILAASLAEKRGDFPGAAEQAVKALYLPVSQEARRRLDGALAYWASRKRTPGDALYKAGREAALRLRRDAVNDQRRAELATLMDRLGLTEEADRLMRQGKAAESAAGSPAERLQRLLDDGKPGEAMPLLLSDIRSWSRQRLTNASTPPRELLADWRTHVQVNGLLPQVMQALLPPQATAQHIAEFAAACELTGDFAQARESYERALAGGVKKKVPQLLLSLIIRDDEARALALLKAFPDLMSDSTARVWMRTRIYDGDQPATLEDTIALIRFLERALEVLPEKVASVFPAAVALEIAASEAWGGEFYTVPQVDLPFGLQLRTTAPPPPAETARIEALAAARLAAFERLARQIMAIPGCGAEAWPHLEAAWMAGKKEPAELLSDGFAMLVRELKLPPGRKRSSDSDSGLPGICFSLMQQAAKTGRSAEFAIAVVPAIRAALSPLAAEKFLENWPLYEAPPEQFVTTARAQLKARGIIAWTAIIEAATFRKLGADLTPDLLARYSHPDPKTADHNDYQFGGWCVWLQEAQGRAAAEKFFHDVMNALLGPTAERAAFFKEMHPARLESAQRLLGNLAGKQAWTGTVLRCVHDEFLPYASKELAESIIADHFSEQTCSRPLSALLANDKLSEAKAYLDSLPMTEDLNSFYGGGGDLMENVSQCLGDSPPKKLAALGLSADATGLTFGRHLLRGAINGGLTGVCQEMAPFQGHIEALPPAQRARVLQAIRGFPGVLMAEATPEARAFHTWLMKEQDAKDNAELEESIAKFLKDAAAGAIESEDALVSRLKVLLHSMAEEQHPRGREVVLAACKLEEGFGTPGTNSALLEMMMEQLSDYRELSSRENGPWLIGLIAAALREGVPPAAAYGNRKSAFGQALLNSEDDSMEGRLDRCLSRLAPFLQPGGARLVMLPLINSLPGEYNLHMVDRRFAAGLRWAEDQRGKCPHEELRYELEMALRFQMTRWDDSGTRGLTDEATLPAGQRHYLALLRDESLPAPLRLTIGSSLLELGGGVVEPPLVHEVARQLHKALTERQSVTPEQEAHVFTALAKLPAASRDEALTKSLLPLTTLPRLRGESNDYDLASGLVSLTDLALRAGDLATVDRLLEMGAKFPGLGVVAVLARHGEKQRLADLLKRRPEVLQNDADACTLVSWDESLQSQLPAVLESLADPVLRFEVLTRLSMLNDSNPLPTGLKPRAARAVELAAAFSTVPWRGLAVRDRVLYRLVGWDALESNAVLQMLEEAGARVPLSAVPYLNDECQSRYSASHALLVSRALCAGRIGQLLAALNALKALEPRPVVQENSLSNCRNTIVTLSRYRLLDAWAKMSEEARAAVCAGWRQMLGGDALLPSRDELADQLHFGLLLHGLAGRMDELTAWHAALPETQHALMRDLLVNKTPGDLLSNCRDNLERMSGTPEEKSARLAAIFTALAVNQPGGGPGIQLDEDYLSIRGTTPADFLTLEEPLTRARPDDMWLALAFLRTHAATGAWDKVLERTTASLARMKPERATAYAPLLELRILALEHSGRGAEALPEIKALATLPEGNSDNQSAALSRVAQARLTKRMKNAEPERSGEDCGRQTSEAHEKWRH